MKDRTLSHYVYLAAGLVILALLVALTLAVPPAISQLLPGILFCGLIVFTDAFGVRLPAGVVSLLPMITAAAFLVTGLVPAGWAAFVGTLIYGWIRARWAEELNLPPPRGRLQFLSLVAINVTMHTGSILAAGVTYRALGGDVPLEAVPLEMIPPLVALGLAYLVFNHLVAGIVIGARSRTELKGYLGALPHLLFYEGAPLVFAPLVGLIYTQLGVVAFVLFASLIVLASLITRGLALTSGRLERRIRELDSLQAVGRALIASLNLDEILSAIYTQVAGLMPADNSYVALYDPETDEVSFPLAYEGGQRVTWRSRKAGTGLTEHILKRREPLLIPKDVGAALADLGIEQIGTPAASWLGVPILAEEEPIGVIAVQSFEASETYDVSHREILAIIAAQAALAIQNARLYARTDEALVRRVQEQASILRTTGEGILLVDDDYRVLAANRALVDFFDIAQAAITHQRLGAIDLEGDHNLLERIGFADFEALEKACREIVTTAPSLESSAHHKQIVVVPGSSERHLERTLTPVRDRASAIVGWLLVFRDISEEIELARLREDMMHMLVHDLRSPLTVLQGSLDIMEMAIEDGALDRVRQLEQMARRGSENMLNIVNELLNISKLESGELPLHAEAVDSVILFRDVINRFVPLMRETQLTFDMRVVDDLPALHVDVELIDRVLHNLVDNAIKFTPDGGSVRLWAEVDPDGAGKLILGVTDTGPGIPPEEQPRLFEKFQQTSATGRRMGTGLGLPFCKLAVEAHGGEIWVESAVGQGSTFAMRLPTVEVTDAAF